MKRRDILKTVGLAGAVASIPQLVRAETCQTNACVLIPSETAGPYPLDLTTNTNYFKKDIRGDRSGVRLNVKLKVLGLNNCLPMQNLRVNIWHCDKDGNYSGYGTEVGKTYLRGYQFTDANGEVEFVTIFPGWYTGRICHIHFQVYVSTAYAAISQLTFPIASKNSIYTANPTLYTKGADPLSFSSDNIFSDGYNYQLASLTPNTTTGGYDCYLELAVQGAGTSLATLEPETGGTFKLGQNFPNPYQNTTDIPFSLTQDADVSLRLFDVMGREVAKIERKGLPAGDQMIRVDLSELNLPTANYAYLLRVKTGSGTFEQAKLMTCF